MKEDGIEIIYSRQTGEFTKGKAYANPRFFSTPRSGVKKVYVVGDWPKVVAAYKAIGVPVERLDEMFQPLTLLEEQPVPPVPPSTHLEVEIPDDWRDLPWIGPQSIRALATRLTDTPVINKAQAIAVITAELAKRG